MDNFYALVNSLIAQKQRSLLIFISMACATVLLSSLLVFYQSTTQSMNQEVQNLAKNIKIIIQIYQTEDTKHQVTYQDYQNKIRPYFDQYPISALKKRFTPILYTIDAPPTYLEQITCEHTYFRCNNFSIHQGRAFSPFDQAESNFILIGQSIAQELNLAEPYENAEIFIKDKQHYIIGTLQNTTEIDFLSMVENDRAFYTLFPTQGAETITIDEIIIRTQSLETSQRLHDKIQTVFAEQLPDAQFEIIDTSQVIMKIYAKKNQ